MYPRVFFERFWESAQRNEVFVCMPFDESLREKYEIMKAAATDAGFERAARCDEDIEGSAITDKIFDGIANAKVLLFDLSSDPKLKEKEIFEPNANVLYELGIATSIREPEDILLIRDPEARLNFDIQGLTVHKHRVPLDKKWLTDLITQLAARQDWSKSKRVKATAELVDGEGLALLHEHGRCPRGKRHFHSRSMPPEKKMSALRLLDLGIIWCASVSYKEGVHEYAYRWTPFGDAVMKYLGIKPMTEEEWEQSPQKERYLRSHKNYQKFRRNLE